MSDLPYFKFYVGSWINGAITLESDSVQGLFINICAHYWFRSGKLSLSEAKKRFSKSLDADFDALINSGVLKVKKDAIRIDFLDEQLSARVTVSKTNSKNGALGGRPKSEKKPTALVSLTEHISESKANESNIEERREEEKRDIDIDILTHICKIFGKEYKLPQDRMRAEANFYSTIDAQAEELLTVLSKAQVEAQADAYIRYCQKTERQLIGKAHKVCETILSANWIQLLGEPPPPDPFKDAAFDKRNMTPVAWEQQYGFQLKNNPDLENILVMRNYMAVKQWASTVQVEKALEELRTLKLKYPWLRCERSLQALETINNDLPKLVSIITHQDKQNAMHNEFIRVNALTDEAIIKGIQERYNLK